MRAFVLQTLWNWFMILLGINPITFGISIGLFSIQGILFTKHPLQKDDEELTFELFFRRIFMEFFVYLFTLGLGMLGLLFI